jgi:translation initiation factor 1A
MGKKHEPEMSREQMEIARIRMPKRGEVMCVVETMLGGDRLRVRCADGKPWPVQSDERADVAYRYTPTQANWLKRKGRVDGISLE